MRVLLIEDHDRLASYLCKGLTQAKFAVDRFARGSEGIAAIECGHYDGVILDLGLPDRDGLEVLKTIRKSNGSIPVLILTSRVQVADRVEGLNAGADDYVTKPVAMEELVARLRALFRRPSESLGVTLHAGNIAFDTSLREVTVGEVTISLSPREMSLLEHLMRRSGKVVPKKVLEDSLYGLSDDLASNSVEVLVHRLRKRLADAKAEPSIHTVRGVGYLLSETSA